MKKLFLLPLMMVFLVPGVPGTSVGTAMRGEGDFEFYVDIASLPDQSAKTLELIQIAVPTKEILYKEENGEFEAAVRIRITIVSETATVLEKSYIVVDKRSAIPTAKDLSGFVYMTDSCYVKPGTYHFSIKIEDMKRQKKTLLGVLRKNYLFSELKETVIEVPSYTPDRLALSEPVLIWRRVNERFVPNPMQIYGLRNDTLSFFVNSLVPQYSQADSIRFYITVLDQSSELVYEKHLITPVKNRRSGIFDAFDLNTFPAGLYRLNVVAFRGDLYASNGKDFSVAWQLVNWQKPRRDLLVEARILLSDNDFESFQLSSLGEQERILNDFWKKLDPTPQTAVNEIFEKFMARVGYADRHFKGFKRGALTDRGQIYIRFGPPNEMVQQSVPHTRADVVEAIDKLRDQYEVVIHSTRKDELGTKSVRILDMRMGGQRPFRGEGQDTGAYELWIYDLKGDPILERDKLMTIHSGLRFLFVDKDGIGEYQLIGTSEEFMGRGVDITGP